MMQTAAVQKISEPNSPYKATLDRAYMIGYTDAINQERSRIRAARERRERKKYFAMQKLNGVALLIFTAVIIEAVLLYCHANFGSPDNQTQLLASYDAMCTKIKGGGYHREANKTID